MLNCDGECCAKKRLAILEAQYGSLVPGTADSFLRLWCAIGKSNSVQAQDLDRKSQRKFSTNFLNETGCSYFKVTCNAASLASLLIPGDSSGVDSVIQEWETFFELDLPQRLVVLGLKVNCGVTVICFGEQPGIIVSFLSAFPKTEFQREVLLGVNAKEELFSIIPSCMVQVNAIKRFVFHTF